MLRRTFFTSFKATPNNISGVASSTLFRRNTSQLFLLPQIGYSRFHNINNNNQTATITQQKRLEVVLKRQKQLLKLAKYQTSITSLLNNVLFATGSSFAPDLSSPSSSSAASLV
jgi:hypothetical protein